MIDENTILPIIQGRENKHPEGDHESPDEDPMCFGKSLNWYDEVIEGARAEEKCREPVATEWMIDVVRSFLIRDKFGRRDEKAR